LAFLRRESGANEWLACQAGVHSLSAERPFGIVAYGYSNAESYAFVGGADVRKIYVPPPPPD